MFFSYANFQHSLKHNCYEIYWHVAFSGMFLKPFKKPAARVSSGLKPRGKPDKTRRTRSPSRILEEEHAATELPTDDVMFAESGFQRNVYGLSRTRSPSRIVVQVPAATTESATAY